MGADSFDYVLRAAEWAGVRVEHSQVGALHGYHEWLVREATIAGGIGPNESDRLWRRHIADSILFAVGVQHGRCRQALDVGSGVGLPGLPLAITHPQVTFDLVDRSGRRCDLLRRIITVLKLDNCRVIHGAVEDVDKRYQLMVSRGALPPRQMMFHVKRLLDSGGVALLGFSFAESDAEIPKPDPGWSVSVVAVPQHILDTPVKLLRIGET